MNNTKGAAGVFLFYGELVLLCRRALEYNREPVKFGGYWSPFAGSREEREAPFVCAARELEEESGLKVPPSDLSYIKEIRGSGTELVLYAYELKNHFMPRLDAEHTEYGYFKLSDLRLQPQPLDPEIRDAIELYVGTLRFK